MPSRVRPSARSSALALAPALALAAACACLLGGCGGSSHARSQRGDAGPVAVRSLDVYSSLPLSGPDAGRGRAVERGIELALRQAHRRAGHLTIHYHALNDAIAGRGAWSVTRTAENARRVSTDANAALYIGELASAATEVSLPILSQAGIPQISPWSPYVGLTQAVPHVTSADEPERYYPTGRRTFVRLAPDGAVEAAAMLLAVHDAGCTRLAVLRSKGSSLGSGRELAALLHLERARYGIQITSEQVLPSPVTARRYLLGLHAQLVRCVAYVGAPSAQAASVIAMIHAELPQAPLIASDQVCIVMSDDVVERKLFAAAAGADFHCTLPAVPATSADTRLVGAWRHAYGIGTQPGIWGTYGYTAMRIGLQTLARLGARAAERTRVLAALLRSGPHQTPLGALRFDADGNSSLRSYGLYRIRPLVRPQLIRLVTPSVDAGGLG